MKHRIILLLTIVLLGAPPSGPADGAAPPVVLMRLTGAVTPANADFLAMGIRRADAEGAGCLVVMLDTPGGLVETTRRMVMAIYESPVPVVVYVSPSGARAASAGVMITMAADVAAMAPATHIGAAHPVGAGGKDIGETMAEKVTNDTVAFVRSIAERRGRNAEWAERSVRESVSVTETEALEAHIVDLVARDLDDLLAQVDGRAIKGRAPLAIDAERRIWIETPLRVKILKFLSDPNIAYILMMIGLAGLYFELSHPGVVLPGVIGSVALVLAFYSFHTLPVNAAGLLLIALALIFFILEMKIASYGLLSVAGLIALLIGSMMLFDRTGGRPGVSWQVILPTLGTVGGFFVLVAGLVFRSHARRPMTGPSGLIGETGVTLTPLTPRGRVRIRGELWFARCPSSVEAGRTVRVTGIDGLVLEVAPQEPDADGR